MPLHQVNVIHDRLDTSSDTVARWLAAAPGAPVVVMIHGMKFLPHDPDHCPHTHILSMSPTPGCARAVSWPAHLGIGRSGASPEPICIAFGWPARGSVWRAWRQSARAAGALATLLRLLHRADPHRTTGILAHSMGARLALAALPQLPRGAVSRLVLLAGAAFLGDATRAVASPAGQAAEFLNVTSRENDLFDILLETLLLAPERTVGAGLKTPHPNWTDLQIDDAASRRALSGLGFPTAAPTRRICHWSGYLRPGLFPLYRAFLTRPDTLPLSVLARAQPRRRRHRFGRLAALCRAATT